jgi:hypothetical protein
MIHRFSARPHATCAPETKEMAPADAMRRFFDLLERWLSPGKTGDGAPETKAGRKISKLAHKGRKP